MIHWHSNFYLSIVENWERTIDQERTCCVRTCVKAEAVASERAAEHTPVTKLMREWRYWPFQRVI